MQFEMQTLHGRGTYQEVETTLTCDAPSTCDSVPPSLPSTAEYQAERAKTDNEYAIKVAQTCSPQPRFWCSLIDG